MVKVGTTILINGQIKAKITTLFLTRDNRWFIGYKKITDNSSGFFLEGDEDFSVVDRGVDQERE